MKFLPAKTLQKRKVFAGKSKNYYLDFLLSVGY